jgi:hypothetical protein
MGRVTEWLQALRGSRTRSCRLDKTASSDSDSSADSDVSAGLSDSELLGDAAWRETQRAVKATQTVASASVPRSSSGSGRPRGRLSVAPRQAAVATTASDDDTVQVPAVAAKRVILGPMNAGTEDICALCEDGGLLLVCDGEA